MISGGQLMYVGLAMICAAPGRFSILSRCSLARCSALSAAFTVFGLRVANSSVKAQTFSG
jgi:hypothetical protein